MHDALERAYERGDHHAARALAHELVRAAHAAHAATQPTCRERARVILTYTAPDPFLAVVGALGLGLTAWLVYSYAW